MQQRVDRPGESQEALDFKKSEVCGEQNVIQPCQPSDRGEYNAYEGTACVLN